MKKWLVVGLILLSVIWGPYVYTELTRSPEKAHGRGRHGFHMFGADEPEAEPEPAAAAEPEAPTEPAAEGEATGKDNEPQPSAAEPEAKPAAPAAAEPAAKAGDKTDKPAEGDPEAEEEPRPVWPSALVPAFKKAFEAEPRDGFWAQSEEPRLRAVFKASGAADDVVSEVACRRTVCRIAFSADDLEGEPEHKLFEALQTEYGTMLAVDPKHSEANVALYLLRKGYQLEK